MTRPANRAVRYRGIFFVQQAQHLRRDACVNDRSRTFATVGIRRAEATVANLALLATRFLRAICMVQTCANDRGI